MTLMLVRNRVQDYDRWRRYFDDDAARAAQAGLTLVDLWRDVDDPHNIVFTLRVEDIEQARAFLEHPRGADIGEAAGVIDGEVTFLETAR